MWTDHVVPGRQGTLTKNLSGAATYWSFKPSFLKDVVPIQIKPETLHVLTSCSRAIGEISGMTQFVPNVNMYLAMYVRKEALLSAQIEGTQCTLDDVLSLDNIHNYEDVSDVIDYVKASQCAVALMDELPLCMHLLKRVHEVLIGGGRGSDKQPGEIRSSQNWIGPAGCTIQTASFLPPNIDDMKEGLSELDTFINEEHSIDPIIKAALIHYQFETLHPFLDGNGRLGRLLITLSLINDGVLKGLLFYPSYQFKLHRDEYYERLTNVRYRGEYEEWIKFFCGCLLHSAEDAVESLQRLISLHAYQVQRISDKLSRGSVRALQLLDALEENPITTVNTIAKKLKVSRTTAVNLVSEFVELGILKERDEGRQRYKVYLYDEYLNILRSGGEPL